MADNTLQHLLAHLQVHARDGIYAVVTRTRADPLLAAQAEASVREEEGITYVLRSGIADVYGDAGGFRAAWLTLGVHSGLEAVGLTAAVAGALAEHGIACNVLAAFYHDHLLVPVEFRDDALAVLAALSEQART